MCIIWEYYFCNSTTTADALYMFAYWLWTVINKVCWYYDFKLCSLKNLKLFNKSKELFEPIAKCHVWKNYHHPNWALNTCAYFIDLAIFFWATNSWKLAKMKSRFLTCPCHKIYRVEAVDLSLFNYTLKLPISANMLNLGKFHENLIVCW